MTEQARYVVSREMVEAPAVGRPDVIEGGHQTAAAGGFSIARREGPWRDALLRRMLALADLLAGLIATASIVVVHGGRVDAVAWGVLLAPIWIFFAKVFGLYDRDQRSLRHLTVDELPSIFTWSLTTTACVTLLLGVTPAGRLDARDAVWVGVVSACSALALRVLARITWRRVTPPEDAIIVGRGLPAAAVRRKLELFPDIHVRVAAERPGLTDDDLQDPPPALQTADRLILASPPLDETLIVSLIAFCRSYQIKLTVVPSVRGFFGTGVTLAHVADLPLLEYNTWDVSRSTQLLKRLIDIVVAAVALVVLSPLLIVIGALVFFDSGRPILFRQVRAGQDAQPFTMLKFRTMIPNAEDVLEQILPLETLDEPVFKLRGDPRVTLFGRFLRRTSLDELPQLANVLRGDMSLVGPRPEQVELVERYAPDQLFRLAVKPGLTGPMQVYGRGELSFEERLAVEREYVENISVGRDLHLLALTFASMVHGRGAF